MNCHVVKVWTVGQIIEMFDWCRVNRIPIVHYWIQGWQHHFRGSRCVINVQVCFLVRDRDIDLWILRFGPSDGEVV